MTDQPPTECLINGEWPSWSYRKWIVGSMVPLVVMYGVCMILAAHNIIRYLILGKKYQIKLMLIFYILVMIILIARFTSLILFIRFFDEQSNCRTYLANELDTCATYFKAILGV